MNTPDGNVSTRIVVSRVMFSWPALLLLLICFELAFGFLIFAIMLRVWLWWMATFATVVFAGLLYWKQKHGRRDWTRVVSLEVRNGKIAFLPSRTMRQGGYTAAEAFSQMALASNVTLKRATAISPEITASSFENPFG